MSNPNSRKSCVVPKCKNTTTNSPEKLFFIVPRDVEMRTKWIKAMKRSDPFGDKSTVYCCEDHFDVETDMENYVKHKLVGGMLKLKKGVEPHKFACQNRLVEKPERSVIAKLKTAKLKTKLIENIKSTSHDVEQSYIEDPVTVQAANIDIDPLGDATGVRTTEQHDFVFRSDPALEGINKVLCESCLEPCSEGLCQCCTGRRLRIMGKPNKNEDYLEKKRKRDRRRRERIKNDPEMYKEFRERERARYQRRKQEKKALPISELLPQKQKIVRHRNREAFRAYYQRLKAKKIETIVEVKSEPEITLMQQSEQSHKENNPLSSSPALDASRYSLRSGRRYKSRGSKTTVSTDFFGSPNIPDNNICNEPLLPESTLMDSREMISSTPLPTSSTPINSFGPSTGLKCTECGATIADQIYSCVQCTDVLLCAMCERDEDDRHRRHVVLRLPSKRIYNKVRDLFESLQREFAAKLDDDYDDDESRLILTAGDDESLNSGNGDKSFSNKDFSETVPVTYLPRKRKIETKVNEPSTPDDNTVSNVTTVATVVPNRNNHTDVDNEPLIFFNQPSQGNNPDPLLQVKIETDIPPEEKSICVITEVTSRVESGVITEVRPRVNSGVRKVKKYSIETKRTNVNEGTSRGLLDAAVDENAAGAEIKTEVKEEPPEAMADDDDAPSFTHYGSHQPAEK